MLVKVALSVFLGPEHTRFPLRSLRRGAEQAQKKAWNNSWNKRGTEQANCRSFSLPTLACELLW
jgi:hypothetical protein